MTNEELKNLKVTLWNSADQLRANSGLKSTEYATPILGLIFLRFAESKYKKFEAEIMAEYNKNKGSRIERPISDIAIEKCGFYLPDQAKYDYLLNLSEEENLAQKLKEAMEAVEKYTTELADTLPKDEYYNINGKDDKTVLKKLLKNFKDIPDNVSIDIFGEIYEYFLGNFALAEGQGGGEFFTPPTVVRYMVEALAPTEGKILDPACGSGGMFVQTAHYIQKHKQNGKDINLRAYGVEKTGATVKLAKMNLVLNNIRGSIIEANSYYNDPHSSFGNFDYVMANPPFNVDGIELDAVKNQPRFNTYGVPQNKTKKAKNDASETVPNGNYLWINIFATALNENGRAALVMANSASDAGNSEKDIRIKLIESGIISQMVTLPSNMFSTVTLPATLWFFNAKKTKKDEILFIDARNVFTQIDRAHRNFSDEQIKNLAIITHLYEGKSEEFLALIEEYKTEVISLAELIEATVNKLSSFSIYFDGDGKEAYKEPKQRQCMINNIAVTDFSFKTLSEIEAVKAELDKVNEQLLFASIWLNHERYYSKGQDKQINDFNTLIADGQLAAEKAIYFVKNLLWLLERFPDGTYNDVIGLCKAAKIHGEDGIKEQDYSLNPGRYVGVVIEEDGQTEEEFKSEMLNLYNEFTVLNNEAKELEEKIAANLKSLFN